MSTDETIISPAGPQPDQSAAAQAEQKRAAQERATKRFNAIAVTLIAIVTLLSAIAAYLQNDAANRQSSAARDMQRYAASQLSAALQSQQAQNFDAAVQRNWLNLSYERSLLLNSATVTDTTRADQLADLMRLTAGFSPMLQAPYLNDPLTGSIDLPRYYGDQEYEPTYWQQRREAAALINDVWNTKSATYVTVLTLFAVALFLFGIAATIGGKLRGAFVILGVLIAIGATTWMTSTYLMPIKVRPEQAMQAMARGHVDLARAEILRDWRQKEDALKDYQSAIDQLDDALKIDPEYPAALGERASAYLQAGEQRLLDRQDASQFLQYGIDDYRAAIDQGDDSINNLWNLGWAYFLLGDQPASLEYTDRALEKAPQIGLYLNKALALRALGKVDDAFAAVQEAYQHAIEQPTSSSTFYFHAAIFDITQQLRAFPNADFEKMLKDVKEKYVSLRYLKGQPVKPTGCQITTVAFFKGLNDNKELIDPADKFPAQIDAVYLGFDYTGLPTNGEIEAVVYFFDKEDETLTVQEKLNLPPTGTGYIRITSPFINAGGLSSGSYRVDIHINGEYLASGEFTVE
ncbi:MAG TPA: tetratricopeptide repeat protein [Anaerolineae bacterium]|nr:tetratricopeptide repeat protein [Anaerolineae bacterium]